MAYGQMDLTWKSRFETGEGDLFPGSEDETVMEGGGGDMAAPEPARSAWLGEGSGTGKRNVTIKLLVVCAILEALLSFKAS